MHQSDNTKVVLNVNKLQHATILDGNNCFFVENELKTVLGFLKEQLQEISPLEDLEKTSPDWLEPWRRHNCISILGQRGIGKTTFLLTLLERIRKEIHKIKILRIIDPSCHKDQHRFLASVIARLYKAYEQTIAKTDHYQEEPISDLSSKLDKIAKGLKYLSRTNGDDLPADIFAERQIDDADIDLNLAGSIHEFCKIVANHCNVDAFILPIEDVDVAFESSWNVLEVLRRYLAWPRLIVVISGDLRMYDMLVTKTTWQEFYPLLNAEKEISKESLWRYREEINKIKEQYLSKLLPHRVLLRSPKNRLISERKRIDLDFSKAGSPPVPFTKLFARLSQDLFGFAFPEDCDSLDVNGNPGVGLIPEATRNIMRFMKILEGWLATQDDASHPEPPSLDPLISLFGPSLFENNLANTFLMNLSDGSGYSQLAEYVIKRSEESGSAYLLRPNIEETKAGDLGVAPLLVHGYYYRGCVKTKAYESFLYYGIRIVLAATEVQDFARRGFESPEWNAKQYTNEWIRYLDFPNSPSATIIASRYRSKKFLEDEITASDDETPKKPQPPQMSKEGWAIVKKPEDDNFLAHFFSIKQKGIHKEYWLQDIYVGLGRVADFAIFCRKQRKPGDEHDPQNATRALMLTMELGDHLPATDIDIDAESSVNNSCLTSQKIPFETDRSIKPAYFWEALDEWEKLAYQLSSMLVVTPIGDVESSSPPLHMPTWVIGNLFESLAQNLRTFSRELYPKNNPSHWVSAFLHSLLIHETLWRGRSPAFNVLKLDNCCNPKQPDPNKDPFVHNLNILQSCFGTGQFSIREGDKSQQWGVQVTTLLWASCPPLFAALCTDSQEETSPCRLAANLIIDCFSELSTSTPYDGKDGKHWKHNPLIHYLSRKAAPIASMLKNMNPCYSAPATKPPKKRNPVKK